MIVTGEGLLEVGDLGQTALMDVAGNVNIYRLELRDAIISGPGQLTITTQFTWIKAALTGNCSLIVDQNATATLVPSETKTITDRQFTNRGVLIWQGGDLILEGNASILNDNDAEFRIQVAAPDTIFSGVGCAFTNYGLVRKELGTGNLHSDLNIGHLAGSFEIASGQWSVDGTNHYWAPVNVAAGATLDLTGFRHTIHPGVILAGNGLFRVRGTTFDNQSVLALTPANFELDESGRVEEIGVLSPTNFLWKDGTIKNTHVLTNGIVTLDTLGDKNLIGAIFTNYGNITWLDGDITFSENYSEIFNYGTFDIRTGSTIQYELNNGNNFGDVVNGYDPATGSRGTIENNSGALGMQFAVPLHNSGRIHLNGFKMTFGKEINNQSGGELKLGGAIMVANGTLRHSSGAVMDLEHGQLFANNSFNALQGGSFIIGDGELVFAYGVTFTGDSFISLGDGSVSFGALSYLYEDAILAGFGVVYGSLVNYGTIDIGGLGIGRITINGTFTNANGALILIGIAGSGLNQFDQLVVNGTANLGGTVTVAFPTYEYLPGDSFHLIEATQPIGSFDVLNLPDLGALNWDSQYQDGLKLFIDD